MSAKIINGFLWLPVTEKAKEIFSSGTFDLYVLHEDNSESLVESYEQINEAQEQGLDIAIEICNTEGIKEQIQQDISCYLDGFDDNVVSNLCKIVVDNFKKVY